MHLQDTQAYRLGDSIPQLAAGDLNGDGRITIADVVRILRAAVGAEKL